MYQTFQYKVVNLTSSGSLVLFSLQVGPNPDNLELEISMHKRNKEIL